MAIHSLEPRLCRSIHLSTDIVLDMCDFVVLWCPAWHMQLRMNSISMPHVEVP